MAFLIDTLIGAPVQRQDEKRLTITKRPMPTRPRDFFELFAAMGKNASLEGLLRGMELKKADPRLMVFAILGRWPTAQERADLESPYAPAAHMRSLLSSREFREPLVRRLFEAFPERLRLLFVRIPRCAGTHAVAVLQDRHPVLPLDFGAPSFRQPNILVPVLGNLLGRFGSTRTLVIVRDQIDSFLEPPAVKLTGDDPLHWELPQTPCRAIDLLFTIIRPPEDLILSEVNGVLTTLRRPAAPNDPESLIAHRATHPQLPPSERTAEWKDLGRRILAGLTLRNPICAALGDGTAAGALAQCTRSPIQLVAIDAYGDWSRSAFDCAPSGPTNVSTPILLPADLTPADRAHLDKLIDQDSIFYARFAERRAALGLPYVSGFDL